MKRCEQREILRQRDELMLRLVEAQRYKRREIAEMLQIDASTLQARLAKHGLLRESRTNRRRPC
jgi:DNA-binding NtrC family response regulator